LVSGWQPAGAAEGGGAATAARVVGAAACVVGAGVGGAAGARDAAEVVRVLVGCVLCTAAAGCVAVAVCEACWLGDPLAVAEAVVVRPAVLPDECDPPEFAATTMMISATKASNPVSALWRAGHDLPRRGGCPWGDGGP
jgi:hypothetical protein